MIIVVTLNTEQVVLTRSTGEVLPFDGITRIEVKTPLAPVFTPDQTRLITSQQGAAAESSRLAAAAEPPLSAVPANAPLDPAAPP